MTFATWLTVLRMLLVIPLAGAIYHGIFGWALVVFVTASITDFLDGLIARRFNQESLLGKALDPIADKLLVATALVSLISIGQIYGWLIFGSLLIILRETFVAGLREFLGPYQITVPVSFLGKTKTTAQLVAIATILGASWLTEPSWLIIAGENLLWLAVILTLISGAQYTIVGSKALRVLEKPSTDEDS